ncbi:hypothetical protein BU23DRAFT_643279, partial [Bimuria novae-zelandiae CBS 107.79]
KESKRTFRLHKASFEEIRAKLESLHQDVCASRYASSEITDMNDWVKQDLVDDNITVTDVETNAEQISSWLQRSRTSLGYVFSERGEGDSDNETIITQATAAQTANRYNFMTGKPKYAREKTATEVIEIPDGTEKTSSSDSATDDVSMAVNTAEAPIEDCTETVKLLHENKLTGALEEPTRKLL